MSDRPAYNFSLQNNTCLLCVVFLCLQCAKNAKKCVTSMLNNKFKNVYPENLTGG